MIRLTELKLPLEHADDALPALIIKTLGIARDELLDFTVFKRSFDARKAELIKVYIVDVQVAPSPLKAALLAKFAGNPHILPTPNMAYHPVGQAPTDLPVRPVVVGFGPCGIFAALVLAQMGFKPIVLERGKTVRRRTQDTWGLWRKGVLNPESNVQFGEGGAGTFSDGKLYSQIKDPRHLGRKVMSEFVQAGAPPEILFEAHPHIGTFKLVKVVENLREQIIALGGERRHKDGIRVGRPRLLHHCRQGFRPSSLHPQRRSRIGRIEDRQLAGRCLDVAVEVVDRQHRDINNARRRPWRPQRTTAQHNQRDSGKTMPFHKDTPDFEPLPAPAHSFVRRRLQRCRMAAPAALFPFSCARANNVSRSARAAC